MNKIKIIKYLDNKIFNSKNPFWKDVTIQDVEIDDIYGQGRVLITKGFDDPKPFTLGALMYNIGVSFTMSEVDMINNFNRFYKI
jgi:hypothetical protein